MNDAQLALDAVDLSFNYGPTTALDGASVQVPTGTFTVLLGANGAGKTTLFSIVTGLYSARGGTISVMGHDLRRDTLAALGSIGVVFQRPTLDMDLTILQNLRYYAALQGISRADAKSRINEAIATHGLTGLEKRKAAALSGGQRRRVELARALLHNPSLVLLDEPTVGLDLQSRADFVAHVRDMCASRGTGVLWATHLVDEVDETDQAIILDKGRVIESGVVKTLFTKFGVDDVADLFHIVLKTHSKTPNKASPGGTA